MSKKRPQKHKKQSAVKIALPPAQLLKNAHSFIDQDNFKKSIECCKDLIKLDPRPEHVALLARCYRLRAFQLAEKGMVVEALASFDSVAQLTGDYPDIEKAVQWLLISKNNNKIARFYQQHQDHKVVNKLLAPTIALQLLLNNQKVIELVAKDSLVLAHSKIARQILQAWCEQDDSTAASLLKQLPFRSAYKDFAQIFKALLLVDSDFSKAQSLFEGVNNQSVFYDFAANLLAIYRFEKPDIARLLNNPSVNPVLTQVKKWSKAQSTEFKDAQSYLKTKRPKMALKLLDGLEQKGNLEHCQQLLAAVFYAGEYGEHDRQFKGLAIAEKIRLYALQCARDENPRKEGGKWVEFIRVYKLANPQQTEQNRRTVSVVYRHMAQLAKQHSPEVYLDCLQASLLAFPTEAGYQTMFDTSDTHRISNIDKLAADAVKDFPQNVAFLNQAMTAATAKKSHKKAATLAKRILKLDPVNQSAQRALVNSHLLHSHRQLDLYNLDKMEKELALALASGPNTHQLGHHHIMQVLRHRKITDKSALSHWLEQAQSALGSPLALRLGLLINGDVDRINTTAISKLIGPIAKTASTSHVQGLLSFANYLKGLEFAVTPKMLQPFVGLIKKSLDQCSDYPSVLECCRHLCEMQLFKLLGQISNQQIKRFSHQPPSMLEFYHLYALVEGDPDEVGGGYSHHTSPARLHRLAEQTKSSGDTAAHSIIKSFLVKVEMSQRFVPDWDDEDEYEEDDDEFYNPFDDDPFDMPSDMNPIEIIKTMLDDPHSKKVAEKLLKEMGLDPRNLPF